MRLTHVFALFALCLQAASCAGLRGMLSRSGDKAPETAAAQGEPGAQTAAAETRPASGEDLRAGEGHIVAASLLQVNGRFFSVDDIVSAAGPRLARLPKGLALARLQIQVAEIITDTLRDKVGRTLVLQEAERRMPEEIKKRIEARLQGRLKSMIAEAGGSRKVLEGRLASKGTSVDEELASYEEQLKVQAYLQSKFEPAIIVNRRMLWEYYLAHRDDFTTPKQVQMQIIAVPIKASGPEEAGTLPPAQPEAAKARCRKQIDKAADALEKGEAFSEVAKRFSKGIKASKGGIWPLMPAGSFREEKVERAAFELKEGQVSDIIETERGFFIVTAKRVIPEKVVSFEAAQAEIEARLRTVQYSRLANDYFEELYESATIVRSEEFFELAVQRAIAKHLSEQPRGRL